MKPAFYTPRSEIKEIYELNEDLLKNLSLETSDNFDQFPDEFKFRAIKFSDQIKSDSGYVGPGLSIKPIPQKAPPPKYIKDNGNLITVPADPAVVSVNYGITQFEDFEFDVQIINDGPSEELLITVYSLRSDLRIENLIVEDILHDAPTTSSIPIPNLLIRIMVTIGGFLPSNSMSIAINQNPLWISLAPLDISYPLKTFHEIVKNEYKTFHIYKLT